MADNNNQQPGLIGSHAQYVKGAAEVGILTCCPKLFLTDLGHHWRHHWL
jgi:hypothetical protein